LVKKLEISNFKSFHNETVEFRDITVLTGTNSSGKSSIIQSILLLSEYQSRSELDKYLLSLGTFETLRNIEAVQSSISITLNENQVFKIDKESSYFYGEKSLQFNKNLFYLHGNGGDVREVIETKIDGIKEFGIYGDGIFGFYENRKNSPIDEFLIKDGHSSLFRQLSIWLREISDRDIDFSTENIFSSYIKSYYQLGEKSISPQNSGTGLNSLISILILCLTAKRGDVIIIEYPESYLHPKSQSKLADFFVFIASSGVQLILETHSDHILNKFRWNIFKDNIASDRVIIHYKKGIRESFQKILIDEKGFFVQNGEQNSFPKGFYDATLQEIFEINSKC
jgi:predicted ATPase